MTSREELEWYMSWPWEMDHPSYELLIKEVDDPCRKLLEAVEEELREAIKNRRNFGTILRIAHIAGTVSQFQSFLEMERDEASGSGKGTTPSG